MNTFKPTASLEMDLMKNLLSDRKYLKVLVEEIEFADQFWINQTNKLLYDLLKFEFNFERHKSENENSTNNLSAIEDSKKKKEENLRFYNHIFEVAQQKIPNFNPEKYEEAYVLNFNFNKTLENYFHFFKCKHIVSLFQISSQKLNHFDIEDVNSHNDFIQSLELIRAEYLSLLRKRISL